MKYEIVTERRRVGRGSSRRFEDRPVGALTEGAPIIPGAHVWKDYAEFFGEFFDSDMALMGEARDRWRKDCSEYRSKRRFDMRLQARTRAAHCHKAEWLRGRRDHTGKSCLFFPMMVHGRPTSVKYNYKTMLAAKAMLTMTSGLPTCPKRKFALHTCGNGHMSCVNPDHLYWGSMKDNAIDAALHNDRSKSVFDVDPGVIVEIAQSGKLVKVLARQTGVPPSVIDGVKSGRLFSLL